MVVNADERNRSRGARIFRTVGLVSPRCASYFPFVARSGGGLSFVVYLHWVDKKFQSVVSLRQVECRPDRRVVAQVSIHLCLLSLFMYVLWWDRAQINADWISILARIRSTCSLKTFVNTSVRVRVFLWCVRSSSLLIIADHTDLHSALICLYGGQRDKSLAWGRLQGGDDPDGCHDSLYGWTFL